MIWDEFFFLILFNFVVALLVMTSTNLLLVGIATSPVLLLLGGMGALLLPPLFFGLTYLVYQISLGNAVKFSTFFKTIRGSLRQAYIWGSINLVVGLIVFANVVFYFNMQTSWSTFVAMMFLGLAMFWGYLEVIALSFYPRLVAPGFKMAHRNALAVMALQPTLTFSLLILTGIVVMLSVLIRYVFLAISVSFIFLMVNILVTEILQTAEAQAQLEESNDD